MQKIIGIILIIVGIIFIIIGFNAANKLAKGTEYEILNNRFISCLGFGILFIVYGLDLIFLRGE